MAGFFSRVKQWIGLENLTFSDLNSEINNIIQKMGADTISGANSTNGSASIVNAMQTTQSPGGVGTEVLAKTLQDDIQQLRYQLNSLIGSAQWYSSPAQSMASLNGLVNGISYVPSNRIISGRLSANDQPMFLVPSGSADTVTLKATNTNPNLATYINGTPYTFTADATITGLSLAPSTNNTCLVDNGTSYFTNASQASKALGECGTTIKIKTIGTGISALNGTYAAFKTGTEYFIAEVDTSNNQLKNAWRGVGFDSTDAWLARTTLTDGGTITLMKLAWIFGLNTAGLDVTYNKPSVSFVAPTSPAIGDYWQDLSVQQWKKYSGTTWVNQSAVMLGLCIQDTTNCKCARSFDFFKGLAVLNDIELEYVGNTDVRSNRLGSKVSVYGTVWSFDYDFIGWNTTNQLDSGESLSASTTYYAYITDKGDRFISTVQPYDRRFDLLGHYMPNKPWRCVGEFATDGISHVTSVSFSRYHQNPSLPPTAQRFTSTGTTIGYLFTISTSTTCAVGDTYTNNGNTYTVLGALSAQSGQVLFCSGANAPTASGTLTRATGSGTASITFTAATALATYTTPANTLYIRVRMTGGGGGGAGTSSTAGSNGTASFFGVSLLKAGPGTGGTAGGVPGQGGSGTINSPAIGTAFPGGEGIYASSNVASNGLRGGQGGGNAFCSGGGTQSSAKANTGTGGGGNDSTGVDPGAGGGGASSVIDALIRSPSSTYVYCIGSGGSGGTSAQSGAAGYTEVTEYYQ